MRYAPEFGFLVLALACWVASIREYRAVVRREAERTARERGRS